MGRKGSIYALYIPRPAKYQLHDHYELRIRSSSQGVRQIVGERDRSSTNIVYAMIRTVVPSMLVVVWHLRGVTSRQIFPENNHRSDRKNQDSPANQSLSTRGEAFWGR